MIISYNHFPKLKKQKYYEFTSRKKFSNINLKDDQIDHVFNRINKSDEVIKIIFKEAGDELFIGKQLSKIIGDRLEITRKSAIRKAVENRFDFLDQAFLSVINAYINMAETSKTKDLYDIMSELKEIVLDFLRKDMQPLVQHLEEIIRYPTRSERLFWLEILLNRVKNEAHTTNNCYKCLSSSIPSDPPIIQLYLLINQILEETESLKNIPDIKLFSKLVLFREELRLLEQESSHIALRSLSIDLIQNKVPNAEMTFIKELIIVKDSFTRISILKKTILIRNMKE
jgi:hypothetical protein